jgi:hypothetical protein
MNEEGQYTDEQLDAVFDAFAEQSDAHEVARKTGLTVTQVREIIEDPHAARRALRRKLGQVGAWFAGSVLDTLQKIILSGSPQHQLAAIKTLKEIITSERMADLPANKPLALPAHVEEKEEAPEEEEVPRTLEQIVTDAEYVIDG